MQIGIDLRPFILESSGGLVPHVRRLFAALAAAAPRSHFHFFATPFNSSLAPTGANVTCHVLTVDHHWQELDAALLRIPVDVLIRSFPTPDTLKFPLSRQVALIPDMQHHFFPQFFSEELLRERRREFARMIRGAAAIGTNSHHSQKTIAEAFPGYKLDIFHITPACLLDADTPIPPAVSERVAKLRPFFFFPANAWPHKNHATLLAAFSRFRTMKPAFAQYRLVLTGQANDLALLATEHDTRNVVHLGHVPEAELIALYRQATALVFFSRFEGFGMPVLEAFVLGCPVACSNDTSLPELVGNAALTCDPLDADAIARAMRALATGPALRKRLVAAGRKRAKTYSWKKSARNLYEALVRTNRRAKAKPARVRWKPVVSLVTPSFNQARFIQRTIDSVLGQDYPHIEYRVIDGGSTDGTVEILKSYGARLKWVSEPDRGQTHAINKGLAAATGQILGYLNSDDTLEPGAIAKVVDFFARHREVDMVYGDANYIDADDKITGPYPTADYSFERLMFDCCVCQPAALWTRHIAERVGPFDESIHFAMDYDYWLRMDRAGAVMRHLPVVLANSRLHPETKTLSHRGKIYGEIFKITRRQGGYVSDNFVQGYWNYRFWERANPFDRVLRAVPPVRAALIKAHTALLSVPRGTWAAHLSAQARSAAGALKPWSPQWLKRLAAAASPVSGYRGGDGWLESNVRIDTRRLNGAGTYELAGWPAGNTRLEIVIDHKLVATYRLTAEAPCRIEIPGGGREVVLRFDPPAGGEANKGRAFFVSYTNLFRESDLH